MAPAEGSADGRGSNLPLLRKSAGGDDTATTWEQFLGLQRSNAPRDPAQSGNGNPILQLLGLQANKFPKPGPETPDKTFDQLLGLEANNGPVPPGKPPLTWLQFLGLQQTNAPRRARAAVP